MNDSVKVQFVGSGDAFGSGGRLQACIHVSGAEENYLLDCGCSSLIGLRRCNIDVDQIDTVIISHLHGDHFGGIPFLLLEAKYLSRRTRPLTIIGPQGVQQRVEEALNALYPGTLNGGVDFPLTYLELITGDVLQHRSLDIRAWKMCHGNCGGALGLQVSGDGKRIAYTGDTEWTENMPLLAAGADLMICECFQYDQPITGHLHYSVLQERRSQLDCRKMVLTHAGEEMLSRKGDLEFPLAYDGFSLKL